MKRIAVLGSTGSIGKNVLNVARHLKESVQVDAIAAHCNIELLQAQAQEFRPRLVAVFDEKKAMELQKKIPHIEVVANRCFYSTPSRDGSFCYFWPNRAYSYYQSN